MEPLRATAVAQRAHRELRCYGRSQCDRASRAQAQDSQQLFHRVSTHTASGVSASSSSVRHIEKSATCASRPGQIARGRVLAGQRFAVIPHAPGLYCSKHSSQYKRPASGRNTKCIYDD
jgi:hypothetical protein